MTDPRGVHLLQDEDSVLVSYYFEKGDVRKYKLQDGMNQPVWKCEGLAHPAGITSVPSGLIYALSNTEAMKIYQISTQGMWDISS